MSKESLSGVDIILPTQESMDVLDQLLGPAKAEFQKAGFDTHTLIEYCVNQWTAYRFDEESIEHRSRTLRSAVSATARVDFLIENPLAHQDTIDREMLSSGIHVVLYYVFKELIPLIEDLNMTSQELYSVGVVNWLGHDIVIKADNYKPQCTLTSQTNLAVIDILEKGVLDR